MLLDVDGARFDVVDEGDGTPIVLLHGFPLSKETWNPQAAALAGGARVVRFDLRALGSTTVTPGPILMEQLAGDLADVLDALRIERAVVVGHSLGGYVALAFFRMFAERCLGLGLVCSRTVIDPPEAADARRALADRTEREGMQPVLDVFVPKLFAPAFYGERPQIVADVSAIMARTEPRGAAAMLRGMAERVDAGDLFEEMQLPALVVAGADDALISVETATMLAAAVPSATAEILPCGHMPQYELPAALNDVLVRFVGRCAEQRKVHAR
ncbi:MAG: alpha/beta fold hydrolase [Candidatus Eremiobacteraeota bacterium]|nr:alpha/beta fold hydrolase [Candidatus Eremiobacteraeota bacterium]